MSKILSTAGIDYGESMHLLPHPLPPHQMISVTELVAPPFLHDLVHHVVSYEWDLNAGVVTDYPTATYPAMTLRCSPTENLLLPPAAACGRTKYRGSSWQVDVLLTPLGVGTLTDVELAALTIATEPTAAAIGRILAPISHNVTGPAHIAGRLLHLAGRDTFLGTTAQLARVARVAAARTDDLLREHTGWDAQSVLEWFRLREFVAGEQNYDTRERLANRLGFVDPAHLDRRLRILHGVLPKLTDA